MERPPNVSDVCATPSLLEVARCPVVLLHLRKMADRIQARAIARCGELMLEISPASGRQPENGGALPRFTRKQAAKEAGLSDDQRKTALRVASIPKEQRDALIEAETPPTVTQLAEIGKQSKLTPLLISFLPTSIAVTSIKVNKPWRWLWPFQIPNRGSDKPL